MLAKYSTKEHPFKRCHKQKSLELHGDQEARDADFKAAEGKISKQVKQIIKRSAE